MMMNPKLFWFILSQKVGIVESNLNSEIYILFFINVLWIYNVDRIFLF